MGSNLSSPNLAYMDGEVDPFIVIRPMTVKLFIKGKHYDVTVQEGFRCDGPSVSQDASVKRLLDPVVHGWCVHDWLYATHGLADFEDELEKDDVDLAALGAFAKFAMKFTEQDEIAWKTSFMRVRRLCGTAFGKAQNMEPPPQSQVDFIHKMQQKENKSRSRRHSVSHSPAYHTSSSPSAQSLNSPSGSRSTSHSPIPSHAINVLQPQPQQVFLMQSPSQFQPSFPQLGSPKAFGSPPFIAQKATIPLHLQPIGVAQPINFVQVNQNSPVQGLLLPQQPQFQAQLVGSPQIFQDPLLLQQQQMQQLQMQQQQQQQQQQMQLQMQQQQEIQQQLMIQQQIEMQAQAQAQAHVQAQAQAQQMYTDYNAMQQPTIPMQQQQQPYIPNHLAPTFTLPKFNYKPPKN